MGRSLFPVLVFGIVLIAALSAILAINHVLNPRLLPTLEENTIGQLSIAMPPPEDLRHIFAPADDPFTQQGAYFNVRYSHADDKTVLEFVVTDEPGVKQYVYKEGWYTINNQWVKFTFTNATVSGTKWIYGNASVKTAPLEVQEFTNHYALVYVCRKYSDTQQFICGPKGLTKNPSIKNWTVTDFFTWPPPQAPQIIYTCTNTPGAFCATTNTTPDANRTWSVPGRFGVISGSNTQYLLCPTGQSCFKCIDGFVNQSNGQCIGTCELKAGQFCKPPVAGSETNNSGSCAGSNICQSCPSPKFYNATANECQSPPSCTNECTTTTGPASKRCSGSQIQFCQSVNGCLKWTAPTDCDNQQVCADNICTSATPTCTVGQVTVPNNAVNPANACQHCNAATPTVWSNNQTGQACTTSNNQPGTCQSGSCVCTPQSDAAACGTKQCGTAVNNCGQTVQCGSSGQCADPTKTCNAQQQCVTPAQCSGTEKKCEPGYISTSAGTYYAKVYQCSGGQWQQTQTCQGQLCNGNACAATCTSTTEICDQKDNDCDGQVDEGNVCVGNMVIESDIFAPETPRLDFKVCNRGTARLNWPQSTILYSAVKKGTTSPSIDWSYTAGPQFLDPGQCWDVTIGSALFSQLGLLNTQGAITIILDPNRHALSTPVTKNYPATGTTCIGTCSTSLINPDTDSSCGGQGQNACPTTTHLAYCDNSVHQYADSSTFIRMQKCEVPSDYSGDKSWGGKCYTCCPDVDNRCPNTEANKWICQPDPAQPAWDSNCF